MCTRIHKYPIYSTYKIYYRTCMRFHWSEIKSVCSFGYEEYFTTSIILTMPFIYTQSFRKNEQENEAKKKEIMLCDCRVYHHNLECGARGYSLINYLSKKLSLYLWYCLSRCIINNIIKIFRFISEKVCRVTEFIAHEKDISNYLWDNLISNLVPIWFNFTKNKWVQRKRF